MSQDLHLKASGFLAEGSSFLANMYCTVRRVPRNRKANSPKSTKVNKMEKRGLNYVPTYVLLFTV